MPYSGPPLRKKYPAKRKPIPARGNKAAPVKPEPKPKFKIGQTVTICVGANSGKIGIIRTTGKRRDYRNYDRYSRTWGEEYLAYGVELSGESKLRWYRESTLEVFEITDEEVEKARNTLEDSLKEIMAI